MERIQASFFGKHFHLKLLLIVLMILFFTLLIQFTSFSYKSYQIERKKQQFIEENERLSALNQEFEKQYEYFKTDYFFRKEAKRKLNKKESGEKVLIVLEKPFMVHGASGEEAKEDLPSKWWRFFFGSTILRHMSE